MENGQKHYYPFNQPTVSKVPGGASSTTPNLNTPQELILGYVKRYPGISQKELGDRSSLKRYILTYNLTKLVELGIIRKFNNHNNVCYEFITESQLQHEILRVLTVKLLNNEITEETFHKLKNKMVS
jgi:DNA-binding MarR family transcriptional regulator